MKSLSKVRFSSKAKDLLNELFKWETYRKLPKVWAIIIGILLSWLGIVAFALFGVLWVAIFLAGIAEFPANYIRGILNDQAKELHPAPAVIAYFFAWPVIILFYCYAVVVELLLYVVYAITHIFMWIFSLAGFKFNPIAE